MHTSGGTLNIYEDAVVKGNVNGNALRAGNASAANLAVNVYGATIEGNVLAVGAKTADYTATLLLDGAKISGTVDVNGNNNFTIAHDTEIGLLVLEDTTKVTLDRLIKGADIKVQNAGAFTVANTKAAETAKAIFTIFPRASMSFTIPNVAMEFAKVASRPAAATSLTPRALPSAIRGLRSTLVRAYTRGNAPASTRAILPTV